jgi:predicted transcriptional regulator
MSAIKVVAFGVQGRREFMRDFAGAFQAAQKGRHYSPRNGVSFTSLEAVRNFLTPKRLALLQLIKKRSPNSLYALAKFAGRSFPSVLKDVELLSKHGLVKLTKEKNSPRRSVHARVSYDAIHLCIGV